MNPFEGFIGFYQLKNIVLVIKNILIRINLSFDNCRGQTYDGASYTMEEKSGVSAQIFAEQQKAVVIHCQGRFLSLAVKLLTKECDILRDSLSVVGEICVLVKFSPKREHLLRNINEKIEVEQGSKPFKKLKKLSTTRWT